MSAKLIPNSGTSLPLRPGVLLTTLFLLLPLWCGAEEWMPLFNGKDLAGWKANTDPGAFTVVDGAIRANATHPTNRSHLFYVGTGTGDPVRFKNFELEAVCRGEPGSNSGIFFHTDLKTRDAKLHLQNGYEVQLNSSPKEKRKTGSLYAIVDLAESAVDETTWFTIRFRVEGKRIRIWVNGRQTVDYTEPEGVQRPAERSGRVLNPEGGAIALQAHDNKSTFYFKSARLRKLP